MSDAGRLLVCATPIGNLGDVTQRVLDALESADAILAEDTRVTRKLLTRFGIKTPLERYDEHVAAKDTPALVERLKQGATLALVSDAGTPGVNDPGAQLIEACTEAAVEVVALPGASAVLTALVASGMPMRRFYFGGFLPRKSGERERLLQSLSALDATLVFFESPHRTAASLSALAKAFPNRVGAMARELTKLHEEVVRGPLPEIAEAISARESLKGEVVLLVAPPQAVPAAAADLSAEELRERVEALVSEGLRRTEAVKRVAAETGVARSEVYDAGRSSANGDRTGS